MDRFTPCTSRPTEVYARRMNSIVHRRTGYHPTVLHHFSTFLEQQESRISQLMRNFDIDLEVSYDRVDNTNLDDASISSSSFGNMVPSSPSKFPPALQEDEPHSSQASTQSARPGRLSPSIIQMILSSNASTVSGISSAADTSYDSGLYQWLGVETTAPGSSGIPATLSEKFDDSANLDLSMMSSCNAFNQPPRIVLPISPPATAVPPFSDTLGEEATGDSFPRTPDLVPHHLGSIESDEIPSRDFIPPMPSNNLSLQHYIPSALVLRYIQEVIDELRGLYVPNDTRNNTPNPHRTQAYLPSLRSIPEPPILSPSRFSHRRNSSHSPLDSVTAVPSSAVLHPSPAADNNTYRNLKTTRELYTEMAVMLFEQVSNEEAQVTSLRNLVDKLEMLAIKKRKIALLIGARGQEK